MSYQWEVIQNEEGTAFACQRTPPFGDEEFETVGWFASEEEAAKRCDELNDDNDDEQAVIDQYCAIVYGAGAGGAA